VLDNANAARTWAHVRSLVGGHWMSFAALAWEITLLFGGERHLYRYAADAAVDALPVVRLEPFPPRPQAVS
jgi:hypothetical protein